MDLDDKRAFYGDATLRTCARCNGKGTDGDKRCNHCTGAGVVQQNGEPPE